MPGLYKVPHSSAHTCVPTEFSWKQTDYPELPDWIPAVNISAADSPTILPIAKITPAKIPGTAEGSTNSENCSQLPAPRPKLPSLKESGTAIKASSVVLIISGNIIIAKVIAPESSVYPQCKVITNNTYPNKP